MSTERIEKVVGKKVSTKCTLSVYENGDHRVSGEITKENIENEALSFSESFGPLIFMVNEFHEFPLGTIIKVTMEVQE